MTDPRSNARKWDERYAVDGYLYGTEPNPLLSQLSAELPNAGTGLDLACGEGQNAVFLASHGLTVTGVDYSAVALRKARQLANDHQVGLELRLWDLERFGLPTKEGTDGRIAVVGDYQVIVCVHYHQPSLNTPISEALAPGGWLVMELHTVANLQYSERPPRPFLLQPNELLTWFPTLQLVNYREIVRDSRRALDKMVDANAPSRQAVAQLVARKPD
jgi:tellurite methyltransferase